MTLEETVRLEAQWENLSQGFSDLRKETVAIRGDVQFLREREVARQAREKGRAERCREHRRRTARDSRILATLELDHTLRAKTAIGRLRAWGAVVGCSSAIASVITSLVAWLFSRRP